MFPLSVYITSRSTNAEFYGYNILWLCAGASTPLNIHLFDLCDIFTANCHEGFKHIPGNDLKLSWQSEELLKLPDHGGDPLTDPSVRAPDHLLRLDLISLCQDDQAARLRTHLLNNGGHELYCRYTSTCNFASFTGASVSKERHVPLEIVSRKFSVCIYTINSRPETARENQGERARESQKRGRDRERQKENLKDKHRESVFTISWNCP